ncbi:MAG: hypothetical protein WCC27_09795, partial [Acidobacteriaceae bacterium]
GLVSDRRLDLSSLLLLAVVALCGYLARCLRDQQKETVTAITTATETITREATKQMEGATQSFRTATTEVVTKVTSLAEVLTLGRDSPSPSESLPTSETPYEPSSPQEIDSRDLPEGARMAEEEEEALLTATPWQSSMQQDVSE